MRRSVNTLQNVFLAFIELEKQLFIKKLLKWANKKGKNLDTCVYLKKKMKKNTWRYHHFKPVYQKPWLYDLQYLRYKVWQTEIGNYGSFLVLLPPPLHPLPHYPSIKATRINIFKKWKKIAGDIIILHKCNKNHKLMKYGFWGTEWDRQN